MKFPPIVQENFISESLRVLLAYDNISPSCKIANFLLSFLLGESPPMGCAQGWVEFKFSCYGFFTYGTGFPSRSFDDARAYCRQQQGDLASIGNADEQSFLQGKFVRFRGRHFWIGLFRNSTGVIPDEGWNWLDGTALKYKNWALHQPDNWKNNEPCGMIRGHSGYWNDIKCSESLSFICERQIGEYSCSR